MMFELLLEEANKGSKLSGGQGKKEMLSQVKCLKDLKDNGKKRYLIYLKDFFSCEIIF